MNKMLLLLSVFMLVLLSSRYSPAEVFRLNGQASAWVVFHDQWQTGLRYIPELGISHSFTKENVIDTEIALNSYVQTPTSSSGDVSDNLGIKPYRIWLRYKTAQFETRLGLQKINFGPAKIMRSLMWFDKINPQDPLKLTDGVYGMLIRYYFLNNSNVWFWGLYGNNELKGLEFVETDKDHVELGGRYQFPLPKGEFAFSYHRRYVDPADWKKKMNSTISDGLENRYALDGNWDIEIGLWLEASLGEIKIDRSSEMWQNLLTIGSDYTFKSGLHLLGEHFIQSKGSKIDKMDETNRISTLSMDYRLNIVDSINAIGYYDWCEEKFYSYLGWQRTYDNWQINLLAFSNREEPGSTFSGKGFQLIVTYNH